MNIEQLKNQLPDYAKDIRLNLVSVLTEEGATDLTQRQIYLIALACGFVVDKNKITEGLLVDIGEQLSQQEINAAKSAAIMMSMNNVYYRFTHLVSDKSYMALPAKLRMNIMANPGIDKLDFELCCLAVSAINGCGMCMDAHVAILKKIGMSQYAIQSAVRIAAVINAFALGLKLGAANE